MHKMLAKKTLSSWVVSVVFPLLWLAPQTLRAEVLVTDLGADQYNVRFVYTAPGGTKSVHVCGSFNGWSQSATPMTLSEAEGRFSASLVLAKGLYEYKFLVDGTNWVSDPDNPRRSGGFDNSVLALGAAPSTMPGHDPHLPDRVDMAAETEHPPMVRDLLAELQGLDGDAARTRLDDWFKRHRMPLFTESSATFLFSQESATSVSVMIDSYGVRTGYRMKPLADGVKLFGLSLARADLPKRAAYLFEVERGGPSQPMIDPHAWSVTSRSGQPAGLVVEASAERGRIALIRDVGPESGGIRKRDVYVYLPPGYDTSPDARYPVLYMHDGQNCWDDPLEPFGHGGWEVNLTADRLIAAGKVQPFIAVGVSNTPDRMTEYGPGSDILSADDHAYIKLLVDTVKPLIDERYRTANGPANTALMGSSMGGIISMQTALLRPDVFGAAACLSPAFFFKDAAGKDYFDLVRTAGKKPVRLYIDHGTAGRHQDGAESTRRMSALLMETGWQEGKDYAYFQDEGAEHNERAWRARLERPLVFLFGK